MRRFLGLWFVLLVSYVFAWAVIGGIGFQAWDLRYEVWIKIVLLPFIQSLVIGAVIFGCCLPPVGTLLRNSIRRVPVIGLLLVIDTFILLAGWLLPHSRWTDLSGSGSIPSNYTGLKGLAAALMVTQLALKGSWKISQRAWLILFAFGVAAFGLNFFLAWPARISQGMLTELPLLLRWIVLFVPLLIASIWVLLKVELIWRGFSEAAGMLINVAVTFALLEVIVVASSIFNRPYLLAPWSTLAQTLGYLLMTSIWISIFEVRRSAQAGHVDAHV